jgi:hypothetical protein
VPRDLASPNSSSFPLSPSYSSYPSSASYPRTLTNLPSKISAHNSHFSLSRQTFMNHNKNRSRNGVITFRKEFCYTTRHIRRLRVATRVWFASHGILGCLMARGCGTFGKIEFPKKRPPPLVFSRSRIESRLGAKRFLCKPYVAQSPYAAQSTCGRSATRKLKNSSSRPDLWSVRRASRFFEPFSDQSMPDCLKRSPTTDLHPLSIAPEP